MERRTNETDFLMLADIQVEEVWNPFNNSYIAENRINTVSSPQPETTLFVGTLGLKRYELCNHLGNVQAVITDRTLPHNNSGTIDFYIADLLSATDYYPFGMVLPGRSLETDKYRFGFNGKEFDKEWDAGEMTYDYGFRIYDPRIIRFLSVDPLTAKYPSWSPYPFAMNRPIDGVDLDGLEWKPQRTNSDDGKTSTLEVSLQAALFNNSSKAYSQDDINKLVSELKSGFMAWNKSGSIDGVTYQLKVTSIDIKYYPGVKYTDNLATEDPKDMEMKYQGSTHVQVPITIEDPTHPMLEGPNADPSCLKGDLAGADGMTSLLVSTKFMDRLSNPNGCPNTLNMPCFGTGTDCATTQTERTSMHEVGHMMGLKHPGKEGATADDNAVAKSKSNVMHQSSESSGKSVGPSQIRKIVKNPAWNTN